MTCECVIIVFKLIALNDCEYLQLSRWRLKTNTGFLNVLRFVYYYCLYESMYLLNYNGKSCANKFHGHYSRYECLIIRTTGIFRRVYLFKFGSQAPYRKPTDTSLQKTDFFDDFFAFLPEIALKHQSSYRCMCTCLEMYSGNRKQSRTTTVIRREWWVRSRSILGTHSEIRAA